MNVSLYERLRENGRHGRLPMHMPGHKRRRGFPALDMLSSAEDITEIDGFDNLHDASGILAAAMADAAAVWHSDWCRFLVNGSSCGILAGIRTLTGRGDTVIVSRNAHKSVFHAIELCGLRPVFLLPTYNAELGVFVSLSPQSVREALQAHPEARLVLLTSPTYEGIVSDVAGIAAAAHEHGVPLMVDEAHGAHLSLSDYFPHGAVACGADLVVQSLHKTMPSLTQTAVVHICGDRVDRERMLHQLAVFETSSPSYLLLASLDGCVRWVRENPGGMEAWADALRQFDVLAEDLHRLRIPFHTDPGIDGVYAYDRSKILVTSRDGDLSGECLGALMREAGVEPEMILPSAVLLMTGAGDTRESLGFLAEVLRRIDREYVPDVLPAVCRPVCSDTAAVPSETALELPWEWVPLNECVGRISAEYVWTYPPGIPWVIPGEVITEVPVSACEMHSTRGGLPTRIAVLCTDDTIF